MYALLAALLLSPLKKSMFFINFAYSFILNFVLALQITAIGQDDVEYGYGQHDGMYFSLRKQTVFSISLNLSRIPHRVH